MYPGREGRGGSRDAVRFLKIMSFMVNCYSEKGSQIQHFQSTLLEEGHKKKYPVYAFENVDNSERPLNQLCF